MTELWIGTTNKGKLAEFALLLSKHKPQVASLKSLGDLKSYSAPPENGDSFLANARIKAKSLKAVKPGAWVLAEDSGLVVDGLGGLPGIHSARYAGPKASDSENVAKLLKMMQLKAVTDRRARFVCQIVAFDPAGNEHLYTGEMLGKIASKPAGLHGFGYDPVFTPEGQEQTLAELGSGFKVQHSHRAEAFRKFLEQWPPAT